MPRYGAAYEFSTLLLSYVLYRLMLAHCPALEAQSQVTVSRDAVWQYSVPLEKGTERRAYLWIPPDCRRVRGVLIGLQNMLERDSFA